MTINSDTKTSGLLLRNALRHTRQEDSRQANRVSTKKQRAARILVVGTGGAGNNTVHRIMTVGIQGAECIAINTDQQHLDMIRAHSKLLIGPSTTRGLGAGGYPEIGNAAAEESSDELRTIMAGADLVFLATGLGGGTGTGSAPVIARIAKEELQAIVVGVVTMPFTVEGTRKDKAKRGLDQLRQYCDTVVVIKNDKLLDIVPNTPLREAFGTADEILASMVIGITETISLPSLVNLDYADVRTILRGGGVAMVGVGEAAGDVGNGRVENAVTNALDCPLLSLNIEGATGALIHVTGGTRMTLSEATNVAKIINSRMDPHANIIWGARTDPSFDDWIRIILIVTGVDSPSILGRAPLPISSTTSGFTSVDRLVESSDFVSLVSGGSPNNPKINLGIGKHL